MGTYDLKDNSLITLKEASMEEVRRRNEPKLVAKATLLRDLVIKLNNQNKTVVVSTLITLELVISSRYALTDFVHLSHIHRFCLK